MGVIVYILAMIVSNANVIVHVVTNHVRISYKFQRSFIME